MLNDKEIAWAANAVSSKDNRIADDAISALVSSTVQAIHSIARSLERIAGPPDTLRMGPGAKDLNPHGDR